MCYFKFIKKKKKPPPCFKLIHVIQSNSTNIWKSTNYVNMLNVQRSINLHTFQGFPSSSSWWLSSKESACQCRGHGFCPWSRKIPYTAEQLISCTTTTEPVLQSPGTTTAEPTCWTTEACAPQQEKPPQWEARAPQLESSPCSPQLEKSPCSNEDPVQPKIDKLP